jgi:hypothetical protein
MHLKRCFVDAFVYRNCFKLKTSLKLKGQMGGDRSEKGHVEDFDLVVSD